MCLILKQGNISKQEIRNEGEVKVTEWSVTNKNSTPIFSPLKSLCENTKCHFDRREKAVNSNRFLSRKLLRNDFSLILTQTLKRGLEERVFL